MAKKSKRYKKRYRWLMKHLVDSACYPYSISFDVEHPEWFLWDLAELWLESERKELGGNESTLDDHYLWMKIYTQGKES